ncbi:inclusion body clearance protein IML2 [Parastagonospora nodorum]|uniref:Inclusion body clearance protein IML2 n=1 Tax=Phaeosphaeria nodorum (strain SN15 / ATCC MYA-4574 / FGSC 10173) TaxID=321614 RepID=A0A7U2F7P7_PHANO|nr:inclusion body clearance protein IML2 [Parastagonospora nodorum]QRD00255.1 inclusion body clearance protein IML2 [Parastagonospora nodorum SN15]KAH3933513.1 inclusion body clearance protein IML2 [Parastagonospora nodorum]KAH4001925.1 inclusion body clearance protein IML2 [Parastagonospora nodorum]KAH4031742.1 inclusion body clearance protein IML2 [Parastagonospora nodorum]
MLKIGGWLRAKAPTSTKSLDTVDELAQIEDAMSSVTYIMNDDLDSAEAHLNKGASSFHQLGAGVCMFMRATLGFEQETMRQAADALYQAECTAYEQQKRAAKDTNAYHSPIYPPGTEYAVCQAEAQLMAAVVGLLNESLTEAIKSFYKLRKAYLALEGIMEYEKNFLKQKSTSSINTAASSSSQKAGLAGSKTGSLRSKTSASGMKTGASAHASTASLKQTPEPVLPATAAPTERTAGNGDNTEDFDFVHAAEDKSGNVTPGEHMANINVPAGKDGSIALDNSQKKLDLNSSSASGLPASNDTPTVAVPDTIEDFEKLTMSDNPELDISTFSEHPVDRFILAGSNFCFGMLLLLLSFVPPAFSSLLKIVGFKGDRERGMQMLWQATKFHDIHGAMAGVVLMGYLNGFTSICDIIPSSGDGSYPKERCKALLRVMRERYPKSHLWLLEESRMTAADCELEKAVLIIEEAGQSQLRQLEALSWFESSLDNMYMHDYKATAIAFQKCVELNNWSHALYWYICGAAYVELYRRNKATDPEAATKYAAEAKKFFENVLPNIGKKRFMGRQLPFDIFVNRKLQKWEARAKEWNCDMIDAIGVSPIEEMIYFWNGTKRMKDHHLETSLENLAWSESADNPHWEKEGLDEKSILAVLRASAYRNMNRTTEAKAILEKEIIPQDKLLFKGHLKDNWTAPCARYEMAANLWREADVDGQPAQHMETLNKCRDWLQEVTQWDGFDLDARIGMKITTGKDTLRKLGVQC